MNVDQVSIIQKDAVRMRKMPLECTSAFSISTSCQENRSLEMHLNLTNDSKNNIACKCQRKLNIWFQFISLPTFSDWDAISGIFKPVFCHSLSEFSPYALSWGQKGNDWHLFPWDGDLKGIADRIWTLKAQIQTSKTRIRTLKALS